MKNIKYIVFIFILLFVNIFCVHASCTDDEINTLKEETKKIKITYKHLGKVEKEEGPFYSFFEVKVVDILDDFYILTFDNTLTLVPNNGKIIETFNSGMWYFDIYSNKCDIKIDTIKVFIPTFNLYSLDPLCEGVDGNDFELCGKYYEYYVEYEDFVQRVTRYRNIHNIGKNEDDEENLFNSYINIFLNFIIKYKIYFLAGLFGLIILFIIVFVIKKKKKRGVLE